MWGTFVTYEWFVVFMHIPNLVRLKLLDIPRRMISITNYWLKKTSDNMMSGIIIIVDST